ncbi:LysR family transcriptional regulator [Brachybacterium sp. Z12]|uniref:LysR family transcriptional regulator n=1 Tax=Brachybacterium sp. Z12 TaxID=2759167 RepID=UPI001860E299|nr:LysR family transcriptional regulator [Brachybacterium sp. Z12]QNN82552.1 LysR family transcriptional regulator [Brachybacterium sp. Z12]
MPRVEQTDWLETFVAVVDHGSFSGAARALHRSQSRVSTHVASLERALGGLLIDRTHRPIGPTELGTTFLPHARAVLETLERGVEAVDQHTGTLRGRVVIGCHPSVSAGFLPDVIASVHALHPQVRVELTEHTTPDLISGIVTGRFHIAIHSLAADPRRRSCRACRCGPSATWPWSPQSMSSHGTRSFRRAAWTRSWWQITR